MIRLAPFVVALLLAGCGAQDCVLDIAHGDCAALGPLETAIPQDDAICRSYGLTPGTPDYAHCRKAKRHVRRLTKDETDDGFLRNPLLPDLR
jgi:hypothetical protein